MSETPSKPAPLLAGCSKPPSCEVGVESECKVAAGHESSAEVLGSDSFTSSPDAGSGGGDAWLGAVESKTPAPLSCG